MQGQTRLIEQTRGFINENPSDIAFTHMTASDDGAGGKTYADTPSDPVTVRLVPQSPSIAAEVRTVDGEIDKSVYSILAMPGTDIRDGDWFLVNGTRFEVATVVGIGNYEVRAEAVRRG